jgi:hypothetical protein
MTNKKTFLAILLLLAEFTCAARYGYIDVINNPQIPKMEIHAGCAVPVGLFGNANEVVGYTGGIGHAGKGVMLGGKFMIPWRNKSLPYRTIRGLFTIVGVDVAFNPVSRDFYDLKMPYTMPDGTVANLEPHRFAYLNIPLYMGLGGEVSANEHVALYGEIGIGASVSKITNTEVNSQHGNYSYGKLQHHLMFDLSFLVEGALVLNDLVTVGIKYNYLSNRKHAYTLTESVQNEDGGIIEQKINGTYERALRMTTLSVFIGVRLYLGDCYSCVKNYER